MHRRYRCVCECVCSIVFVRQELPVVKKHFMSRLLEKRVARFTLDDLFFHGPRRPLRLRGNRLTHTGVVK